MFPSKLSIAALLVIISCLFGEGYAYGAVHRSRHPSPAPTPKITILLYHHIEDMPDSVKPAKRRWAMSPQKLSDHLDWIEKEGFQTITMEQWVSHLRNGDQLPPKPIILTFDDGWKDQYTEAFPLLKKHHFTATFFIITGSVGHSAYLSWEQIKEMAEAGMDIQSHTLNHPRLPVLSKDKALHEILDSKKELESRLNKPVTILAYPYGLYDQDVIDITQQSGYQAAVTVGGLNGGYLLRQDKTYLMSRYAIEWGDDLARINRWRHFDKY